MRTETIRFRVSKLEKSIIQNKSKKCGLIVSEFCRNAIFDKRITYALTDEEIKIYNNLTRFINDFERLANYFKHKDSILSNAVRQVAYDLKNELRKFKR